MLTTTAATARISNRLLLTMLSLICLLATTISGETSFALNENENENENENGDSSSSNNILYKHRRLQADAESCTVEQAVEWKGLWSLKLVVAGPSPGPAGGGQEEPSGGAAAAAAAVQLLQVQATMEDIIQTEFGCIDPDTEINSFHELVNVTTIRWETTPNINNNDRSITVISWLVQVQGITNLIDFDAQSPIFYEEEDPDDSRRKLSVTEQAVQEEDLFLRRQLQQERVQAPEEVASSVCVCSNRVNKQVLLSQLNARIALNFKSTVIARVASLEETVPIDDDGDCQQAEQEETPFVANLAMTIQGNWDQVTDEFLELWAETVIAAYNQRNSWWKQNTNNIDGDGNDDDGDDIPTPTTCDLNSKSLMQGTAFVDSGSIRRGQASRRLQDGSAYPSSDPSTSTTNMTMDGNASDTDTEAPTQSPTTRGPDLFTILLILKGTCVGCATDAALFNQVSNKNGPPAAQGERYLKSKDDELLLQEENEAEFAADDAATASDRPPSYVGNGRELNSRLLFDEKCVCPIGGEIRSLTQQEFLDEWQIQVEQFDLPFFVKLLTVKQVTIFECLTQAQNFTTFTEIQLQGDLESFQTSMVDQALIANRFVHTFRRLSEESCDPFQRQVDNIIPIRIGKVMPSEPPSNYPSSNPTSSSPSEDPQRLLIRKRQANLNDRALQNVELDSSEPSVSLNPTESPTTRGPDLFFLLFQLAGVCNGCPSNTNLFDQLTVRRKRQLIQDDEKATSWSSNDGNGFRFLEELGKCSCDKDAAEDNTGVTAEEFAQAFGYDLSELNLTTIETLERIKEQKEAPPTASPSSSASPSAEPSQVPTMKDSTVEFPSSFPSSFPSTFPSAFPSIFPSVVPSGLPSQSPSGDPSSLPSEFPSVVPSGLPSQSPSGDPSLSPSSAPSSTPTESAHPSSPSVFPSAEPSQEPSSGPSSLPSVFPSTEPSSLPTVTPSSGPSFLPSVFPSVEPSSLPSAFPTVTPSSGPSFLPSVFPSVEPSSLPSTFPSSHPSECDIDDTTKTLVPGDDFWPAVGDLKYRFLFVSNNEPLDEVTCESNFAASSEMQKFGLQSESTTARRIRFEISACCSGATIYVVEACPDETCILKSTMTESQTCIGGTAQITFLAKANVAYYIYVDVPSLCDCSPLDELPLLPLLQEVAFPTPFDKSGAIVELITVGPVTGEECSGLPTTSGPNIVLRYTLEAGPNFNEEYQISGVGPMCCETFNIYVAECDGSCFRKSAPQITCEDGETNLPVVQFELGKESKVLVYFELSDGGGDCPDCCESLI